MSLTSWFLVSGGGTRHRLPREMIFVGRDDCELMLQSRSVDKQHAVINYEPDTDEHKVKDLGSLNGTFVNEVRIQEQSYVTLKIDDKLRFGYDPNLFTVFRGELHIPEEALKHEKFSSQLQLSQKKPLVAEASKAETKPSEATSACEGASAKPPEATRGEDKMAADLAVLHRGTPLYGQPAWWGDEDAERSGRPEENRLDRNKEKAETDTKKSAEVPKSANPEPSYFEIPTKDTLLAAKASGEAPLRGQAETGASSAAEPSHGHASFTIEFDSGVTGKVTVKDRVTKVGPETRPRPKRAVGEELSPLQTAMVAAEVKVADWLAQNELPLTLKDIVAEDDGESVKSDVPVHLRSLKDSKHEDGTQSDSENALGEERRAAAMEERSWGLWGGVGKIREGRANVPEGLFAEEESPARRRKSPNPKAPSGLVERRHGPALHQQTGRDGCYHPRRDDYSDRGTYTVELDSGEGDEEEARKRIDKVFGVDEQEPLCVSRLAGADQRQRITPQWSAYHLCCLLLQVLPEELVVGGPRWVSQWATLAASHVRTDPEGSGGESHVMVTEDQAEINESGHPASFSSSGHTERKRRILPQLPGDELVLGRRTSGSGLRVDLGEKQDTELQEKENLEEKMEKGKNRSTHGSHGGAGSHGSSPSRSSPAKSQDSGRSGKSGATAKLPPRPLTSGEKRREEVPRRKGQEDKSRDNSGKPLLRQESFTVEKPSSSVPIELIPRIDGLGRSTAQGQEHAVDVATLKKDSEAVAAFLETTVSDQGDPPSQSIEGSVSPESDVDTTSTVSQAEGARKVVQKRRTLAGQQKEKTVVCSKGPAGVRDSQDRRAKPRAPGPPPASQPWTSLDLTDDDVNSNSLLSDSQVTSTRSFKSSQSRAQTGSTMGAAAKTSRAKAPQAATASAAGKPSNVPKPRPTRTSLLRRARLGDSSDTEPADLDRMSVASEASTTSSTSRTGMARKGISRIEALAQPRRPRVGSPSAQSDSEATVARSRGFGARSAAGEYAIKQGLRTCNAPAMSGPRARANSASKLPDKSKGTSAHVAQASVSRWRRVPVEYASTSEDEYGSNRHTSKQGQTRAFSSTRVTQLGGSAPASPSPAGLAAVKQQPKEQEEYMRDWTAHSEEIARISQDLAKDLAMLAREIHDVAGEIDSVSPAATDPGILVFDTINRPQCVCFLRSFLQENVFDDSLELSGPIEHSSMTGSNGQSVELRSRGPAAGGKSARSIRRQTWNREEAVMDSLLLVSVFQLATRIRQYVEKTACKIRILLKDKERKWEEIELKLQTEHDSLVLKSSNKELASIVQDLKRVEQQLLVIDMMVDPDGTLDALSNLGLTSPL
uniref:Centrosomal protein 170Ab n=1 Tax=Tetraodon nigroviridis TaxID=99883 RepID=H3D3F3_TETNG